MHRRHVLQGLAAGGVIGALGVAPDSARAQSPAFPRGAVIRTLFKDYPPEELGGGATLFHEHLSLGADFSERFGAASRAVLQAQGLPVPERPAGPPPATGPDPMRDADLMAQELRTARDAGVACIVDAGLEGAGADIEFIRKAAQQAAFPVVKGAGFYTQPFYPDRLAKLSEQQIADAIVRQADEYPAGAFGEIGSWDEISTIERRVFRAVGRAHVATNLPIFTHTGIPGKSALEQLDLLEDAGVDPRRVCIGHLGHFADANVYVHKALCRRGAYVGFDRQGGRNDTVAIPLVKAVIDAGFADQVLISGDAFRGYAAPITQFLPKLEAAGIDKAALRKITVDNPRRFLSFVPKRARKR